MGCGLAHMIMYAFVHIYGDIYNCMHTCAGCYQVESIFIQCLFASLVLPFFRGHTCTFRQSPLPCSLSLTTVVYLIAHWTLGLLLDITYLIFPFQGAKPKPMVKISYKSVEGKAPCFFYFSLFFHMREFSQNPVTLDFFKLKRQ